MGKLEIEKRQMPSGRTRVKITGFKEGELYELKAMKHEDAEDRLIEMLNERNGGIGNCWARGYGIFSLWFDDEAAYMNIGNSCD